jgi:hypothetical protein
VAGIFRNPSPENVLVDLVLKMKLQLVVKFLPGLVSAEEGTKRSGGL